MSNVTIGVHYPLDETPEFGVWVFEHEGDLNASVEVGEGVKVFGDPVRLAVALERAALGLRAVHLRRMEDDGFFEAAAS